jgi:hypothetical protein
LRVFCISGSRASAAFLVELGVGDDGGIADGAAGHLQAARGKMLGHPVEQGLAQFLPRRVFGLMGIKLY